MRAPQIPPPLASPENSATSRPTTASQAIRKMRIPGSPSPTDERHPSRPPPQNRSQRSPDPGSPRDCAQKQPPAAHASQSHEQAPCPARSPRPPIAPPASATPSPDPRVPKEMPMAHDAAHNPQSRAITPAPMTATIRSTAIPTAPSAPCAPSHPSLPQPPQNGEPIEIPHAHAQIRVDPVPIQSKIAIG